MNCSLCHPCFPCSFMKFLKQENKKVSTSAPIMLESYVLYPAIPRFLVWYLLSLCSQSRSSAVSEGKMLYIVFLLAANPKDFRENVKLTC